MVPRTSGRPSTPSAGYMRQGHGTPEPEEGAHHSQLAARARIDDPRMPHLVEEQNTDSIHAVAAHPGKVL